MMSPIASVCLLLSVATSSPESLEWHSKYGKALAETRNSDRPLVVVLDKPGVAEQAMSDELLKEGTLAKYELCHVDVSSEYGQAVAEAFNASEFPYVAIIDKNGKYILNKHVGQISQEGWTAKLSKYEAGTVPQKVTVNKPVTSSQSYPSYDSFQSGTTKPYCAKCQRGY